MACCNGHRLQLSQLLSLLKVFLMTGGRRPASSEASTTGNVTGSSSNAGAPFGSW